MAYKEAVLFNLQLTTVFVEHQRRYADFIREQFGLTYNEMILLLTLNGVNEPIAIRPITEYLMLERKTVLTILANLESKDLIVKQGFSKDARIVLVSINSKGNKLAQESIRSLMDLMREEFTQSLPEQEFSELTGIRRGIDKIRGFEVAEMGVSQECQEATTVDYMLYWRTLVDSWTSIIKDRCNLAFNEYRILALTDNYDALSPGDIARLLVIESSAVSIHKASLLSQGLVQEAVDPFDSRGRIVRCSAKGTKVVRSVWTELEQITRVAHNHLSEKGIGIVNAWYLRMYSNLRMKDEI